MVNITIDDKNITFNEQVFSLSQTEITYKCNDAKGIHISRIDNKSNSKPIIFSWKSKEVHTGQQSFNGYLDEESDNIKIGTFESDKDYPISFGKGNNEKICGFSLKVTLEEKEPKKKATFFLKEGELIINDTIKIASTADGIYTWNINDEKSVKIDNWDSKQYLLKIHEKELKQGDLLHAGDTIIINQLKTNQSYTLLICANETIKGHESKTSWLTVVLGTLVLLLLASCIFLVYKLRKYMSLNKFIEEKVLELFKSIPQNNQGDGSLDTQKTNESTLLVDSPNNIYNKRNGNQDSKKSEKKLNLKGKQGEKKSSNTSTDSKKNIQQANNVGNILEEQVSEGSSGQTNTEAINAKKLNNDMNSIITQLTSIAEYIIAINNEVFDQQTKINDTENFLKKLVGSINALLDKPQLEEENNSYDEILTILDGVSKDNSRKQQVITEYNNYIEKLKRLLKEECDISIVVEKIIENYKFYKDYYIEESSKVEDNDEISFWEKLKEKIGVKNWDNWFLRGNQDVALLRCFEAASKPDIPSSPSKSFAEAIEDEKNQSVVNNYIFRTLLKIGFELDVKKGWIEALKIWLAKNKESYEKQNDELAIAQLPETIYEAMRYEINKKLGKEEIKEDDDLLVRLEEALNRPKNNDEAERKAKEDSIAALRVVFEDPTLTLDNLQEVLNNKLQKYYEETLIKERHGIEENCIFESVEKIKKHLKEKNKFSEVKDLMNFTDHYSLIDFIVDLLSDSRKNERKVSSERDECRGEITKLKEKNEKLIQGHKDELERKENDHREAMNKAAEDAAKLLEATQNEMQNKIDEKESERLAAEQASKELDACYRSIIDFDIANFKENHVRLLHSIQSLLSDAYSEYHGDSKLNSLFEEQIKNNFYYPMDEFIEKFSKTMDRYNGGEKGANVKDLLLELQSLYESCLSNIPPVWIDILGRLYAYSQVPFIMTQFDESGLNCQAIQRAFTSLEVMLNGLGITLNYPRLFVDTYDSSTYTKFDQKSIVDYVEGIENHVVAGSSTIIDLYTLGFSVNGVQKEKPQVSTY